ncbi:hypothetical protein V1278_000001, partial [Bradyrhizobium sp. AZCC 1577]|uniref:hypothetical protein n=1 Tax=Bradyrhizobium sp. AZCC 1577 TaxID=3117019 RepID=UPI002FF38787
SGGSPAAFRPLHDGLALGRAEMPATCPAAFSQADLKKRELVWHRYGLSVLRSASSSVHEKGFETTNNWE